MAKGFDKALTEDERLFFYIPLMHSENIDDQRLCVQLFEGNKNVQDYARRHLVIIEKFGRFPHRNAILARESTLDEIEFLKTANSSF